MRNHARLSQTRRWLVLENKMLFSKRENPKMNENKANG